MKQLAPVLLATVFLVTSARGETVVAHYSLLDNLNEKLFYENLANRVVLGKPERKHVPIIEGAEFLMNYLAAAPQFKKDRIWSRLAHTHPVSTIAFREEDNPSTHVLFRKLEDGSLKADIHLDGNGPQKLFPHLDEFFYHKLTFQDNNQDRMHANLNRAFVRQIEGQGAFLTRRERTMLYIHQTLGLQPLASAFSEGLLQHYAHELVWKTDRQYEPMLNRFEGSLMRGTIRKSIEFGVADWRQEDTRYKSSGERGLGNRVRAAIVNTFVVPTPTAREFAYGRFAGIIGTTAAVDVWHPWRAHPYAPNYARQATLGMVVNPLAKSMWAEFKPDIKRRLPFHRQ